MRISRGRSRIIKKILLSITLVLMTYGGVTSTYATQIGTSGTDLFSFLGTIQTVNTNLVSPSGQNVTVNGTFRVGIDTYDGLGGFDILSMTNDGDFLVSSDVKNIEQFLAGDGNDVIDLSGQTSGVTILLGADDDIGFGGIGDDIIFGAQGNDFIDGGAGNDIISINDGAEYVTGGLGNDIFNFTSPDSFIDTITDLTSGDILHLDNLLQGFNPGTDSLSNFVQFNQQNNDVMLSVNVTGLVGNSFEDIALLKDVKLDDIMLLSTSNIHPFLAQQEQSVLFGVKSSAVPEPSILALLGIGLIGLMRYRRYS